MLFDHIPSSSSLLRALRLATLCAAILTGATVHAALKVVTTTPDLAALVAEIGGDQVSVTPLSRPGQDPHYVDPKPSLVVTLARADMLVFNGLELEIGWLPPLQTNSRNAAIQQGGAGYFDASRHVQPLEVSHETNRAMGDIHPGGNPHYLYDPRRGAAVAKALGTKLGELAPEQRDFFLQSADRVARKLQTLAHKESARFRALAPEKRRVVTYHRSLVYIIDWLGLERPITVEPRPGVAPSPSHVARVLSAMRSQKIGTILQERFYPTKTSETLARMTQSRVVILPGGANFMDKKELYSDRIQRTTEAIYGTLAR